MTSYVSVYPKLVELKNSYGPIEEFDDFEESKTTLASRYNKSDYSPKDGINIKRERSDYSEDDDSDGEGDEEESEIARLAEPKKKVKLAVGSRKSNRKIEESFSTSNERNGMVRQTTTRPKEQKKPAKKPVQKKATKSSLDYISKANSHPSEIKTETDEMNLKSEPDTSSGLYEKVSMVSSPDRGPKRGNEKVATKQMNHHSSTNHPFQNLSNLSNLSNLPNFPNLPNLQNLSGDLMSNNFDLLASIQQQQQQRSEQEKNNILMNMMYSGRGNQATQNSNLYDMMQIPNSLQNTNMAVYQQMIQSQLAAQLQQQQKQHQFLQLQQQLRFIQEKNGMEIEKEKLLQAELANKMAQSHQAYGNLLSKNQQFPLIGLGNRPQTSIIPENISPQSFNGIPTGNSMETNPNHMLYMNMNKTSNMGKRNGMFNMPKPE